VNGAEEMSGTSSHITYNSTGARQRRTFGTFHDAESEAAKLKEEIRRGGWDLVTLRGSERLAYQRAMETLRPLGVPLDLAVFKLVESLHILGSDQLIEAARFFCQHSATTLPRKTVPEVFEELLSNRKANGKSELYVTDLKRRLGRFFSMSADAFQRLAPRDSQRSLTSRSTEWRAHCMQVLKKLQRNLV